MANRSIEIPWASDNITTRQAARYLGVESQTFERLAEQEADWLRPVYFGRTKRWAAMDVIAFAHVYRQRLSNRAPAAQTKEKK